MKPRFTGIFYPHGMAPGYWIPKTEGSGFEFSPIMMPLEPLRDRTVILSGLYCKSAEPPPGVTGADHWVASAFVCEQAEETAGASLQRKHDHQMIAQKIGQDTLLPSLQMGIDDPQGSSSTCGEGYSCAYTNSISWSSPTRPIRWRSIRRLYLSASSVTAARHPSAHSARAGSQHLDLVTHSLSRLKNQVGPSDRRRLDEYLEDVREIERRLGLPRKHLSGAASTVPTGVPESFDEHY